MSLHGQVALITGGSRGIGRACALHLGALGAKVAINYAHNETAARSVAEAVVATGGSPPLVVQADVADAAQVERMVDAVSSGLGPVEILVNNAGIQRASMAHRMTDEDWDRVIATNLSGAFYTSRAVLPSMRARGAGQIVNIASASSYVTQMGAASYVASKHGLLGLTKALALENASKGLRINAVAPGLTDTDLVGDLSEAQRESLQRLVPMGRMATPAEVAEMVAWVLTGATYSTGNVFQVSGGVYLG